MNPLKKVMEIRNYTYQELGEILGITRQAVYNICYNYSKPSAKVILLMLIAFKRYITPLECYNYYFLNNNDTSSV